MTRSSQPGVVLPSKLAEVCGETDSLDHPLTTSLGWALGIDLHPTGMRGPRAWGQALLLAGLAALLTAAQEHEACIQTGYFDSGNPCAAPSPKTVCPPGCVEFLKDLPPVCQSTLAGTLTHQAAYTLGSRCGANVGRSSLKGPGGPQAAARTLLADDPGWPSSNPVNRYCGYIYYDEKLQDLYASCRSTSRTDCRHDCVMELMGLNAECLPTVFANPTYGKKIYDVYVNVCLLTLPPAVFPSPSQGTPPPGLPPPLPVELSPSPLPRSPMPSEVPSGFACEGEYSWVLLNPSQASQWGEAAPETGAPAALEGKCSSLHNGNEQTHSGCCSETLEDLYPWWQYDLGSERQVKGIRLTPAQAISCCLDASCTQPGPCYERLEPSYISVGSLSLPQFYASQNYTDLLTSVGGNATEAQPAVLAALEAGSTICNAVTVVNLVDSAHKTVDHVSIGCGVGLATGTSPIPTKGRYVTIIQDTVSPESLALCGIQICASS